jgi:hypothetical protein
MSDVECAGSVDTSSTRLPARLAASAIADAHVVLPTPPLPPKNSTFLSMSARISVSCPHCVPAGSATWQIAERRAVHPHAAMPLVKLLEHVGIDGKQIQRRGIRQADDLHVTQQQEEIVQLGGLLAQLALVGAVSHAMKEIPDVVANGHQNRLAG